MEALGGSGRHLGGSRRHLGGSWAALGRILEPKLEDLEAILGGVGGQVGGLEANLEASWSQVGRFLGQLGGLGDNLRRFFRFSPNSTNSERKKTILNVRGVQIGGF